MSVNSGAAPSVASKSERIFTIMIQVFLYGIIFLAGFIFAKIQTLVSGL